MKRQTPPDRPRAPIFLRRSLRPGAGATISFDHSLYGTNRSPEKKGTEVVCQFTGIKTAVLRSTFTDAGLTVVFDKSPNFVVAWSPEYSYLELKALKPGQKVNHFISIGEIGRKDKLSKNMMRSAAEQGGEKYDFYAFTFFYPNDKEALRADMLANKNKVYIKKPSASSRGRGIYLITSVEELEAKEKDKPCIVQRYIDPPLLVNGFKFDLRVYCLITSIDPLRVYIYKEGLARFCTRKYRSLNDIIEPAMKKCILNNNNTNECELLKERTMESMHDEITFTHLTNFSLNKFSPDFKAPSTEDGDESSSKWSMTALFDYLEKEVSEKVVKNIWDQIRSVTAKAWMSVSKPMKNALATVDPLNKAKALNHCYELIGLDFMIDSDFKVWLIEANITPATGTKSPLDLHIKSGMLRSMYDIVGVRMPGQSAPDNVLEDSVEEFYRAVGSNWQRVFPNQREDHMRMFDSATENDAKLYKLCKEIASGKSASSLLGFDVDKKGWSYVVQQEKEMAEWAAKSYV